MFEELAPGPELAVALAGVDRAVLDDAEVLAMLAARDRTCRAPGCRAPAHRCDLDHTRRWTDGGPTTVDNLAALCRHHHRMKDHGGRRLCPIRDGVFAWHSPLGHTYLIAPEPP